MNSKEFYLLLEEQANKGSVAHAIFRGMTCVNSWKALVEPLNDFSGLADTLGTFVFFIEERIEYFEAKAESLRECHRLYIAPNIALRLQSYFYGAWIMSSALDAAIDQPEKRIPDWTKMTDTLSSLLAFVCRFRGDDFEALGESRNAMLMSLAVGQRSKGVVDSLAGLEASRTRISEYVPASEPSFRTHPLLVECISAQASSFDKGLAEGELFGDTLSDGKGWSPLHYAVANPDPLVAPVLLARGACYKEDIFGKTPFDYLEYFGTKTAESSPLEAADILYRKSINADRRIRHPL